MNRLTKGEKMSNMGNLFLAMQEDALRLDKDTYLEMYKNHLTDAHHIWERMHGPEGPLEHPDIVTSVSTGKERGNR